MHGRKYNNVDKEQNVTDITFHEYDTTHHKTMISKLYESFYMIASFIVNSYRLDYRLEEEEKSRTERYDWITNPLRLNGKCEK